MDDNLSIEMAVDEVKMSIARYANILCQKYSLPPIIMIQILQEIVYENKINTMTTALAQLRSATASNNDIPLTEPSNDAKESETKE